MPTKRSISVENKFPSDSALVAINARSSELVKAINEGKTTELLPAVKKLQREFNELKQQGK